MLPNAPFHDGERAVQQRLGVRERMAEVGPRVIRDHMPQQHQLFFAQLPFMPVASVDEQGRPWASVLVGQPGFLHSPDARHLQITTRPVPGDPLAGALRPGAPLGFLGIELHTRRRNRMNGHVSAVAADGFVVQVDQTIGNCPQYIQARDYHFVRDAQDLTPRGTDEFDTLDTEAQAHIAAADTLFVATHAPGTPGQDARGADVSHRGGRSGFVKVEDARTLLVPDFSGNLMFMTLGNMLLNPRTGLLFIDFTTGDLLLLTGRAEIVWDGPDVSAFGGAERAWRFRLDRGLRLRDALPLRWSAPAFAPTSLATGAWPQQPADPLAAELPGGWRTFRVIRAVDESSVIRSLVLQPVDGMAPPPFEAGQYLPIRLPAGAGGAMLRRTYTISSAPQDNLLRLSIKREGAAMAALPAGRASNYLHDHIAVGDTIDALAPQGRFTIDAETDRPAVLIAAGVGITPMVSFLRHLAARGNSGMAVRQVFVIQLARNANERAFADELQQLQSSARGNVTVHSLLSQPHQAERSDPGAPTTGRLRMEHLKQWLPFDDHEFYLCGPAGFTQSVYDGLRALGVRDERIHAEAFGPAALQRRNDSAMSHGAQAAPKPVATEAVVHFVRSAKTARWTPQQGSLLELAENLGLSPAFSCRSGNCGSCVTPLRHGDVTYPSTPGWQCGPGEALLCSALPAAGGDGRLEFDL